MSASILEDFEVQNAQQFLACYSQDLKDSKYSLAVAKKAKAKVMIDVYTRRVKKLEDKVSALKSL